MEPEFPPDLGTEKSDKKPNDKTISGTYEEDVTLDWATPGEEFLESLPPDVRRKRSPRSQELSQKEIQALRQTIHNSGVLQLSFYFLDYILRAQTALFEQIHSQKELPRIIASMSILCILLSAIYGVVMGMYNGVLQAIASAIKLPILFLLTALICIPSLYTFNVLLGQSFKFLQTVALMVMTLGTTTILLASLAPIAFFFGLTTQNYQFLLLMHVLIFGLCGIYGVRYLYRGCSYIAFRMEQPLNNLLLRIWIGIYAIVGMQLGWRLRPFIGNLDAPFQIFRVQDDGGNFYTSVWRALNNLF
ncbi:MAG: actin-binding WH2 domain-containing protein [Synechococcales bacterium]|nr:actin-binding WH2 domain-containing protein [Synechococcales bacterium]